jgi:beta-fructofuranosidase
MLRLEDRWVWDFWLARTRARAAQGPVDGRGVIGHATSDDLVSWTVQPPLSELGEFGHLEVPQVEVVDGAAVFIFSVAANDVSKRRRLRQTVATATYICPGRSPLGPFDLTAAQPVPAPHLYAGRLDRRRDGSWVMLGFVGTDAEGRFVGEIGDPIPVRQLGVPGFGPGADRRDR